MTAPLPDPRLVLAAVEMYVATAYDEGPPRAVAERIALLQSVEGRTDRAAFFAQPVLERKERDSGPRFSLRLGNAKYPFMKLTVDPCPDGSGYLFKADTHDSHVCPPPGSDERQAFMDLMAYNEQVATAIEGAWELADVPTFKSWLKADLARRTRGPGSP